MVFFSQKSASDTKFKELLIFRVWKQICVRIKLRCTPCYLAHCFGKFHQARVTGMHSMNFSIRWHFFPKNQNLTQNLQNCWYFEFERNSWVGIKLRCLLVSWFTVLISFIKLGSHEGTLWISLLEGTLSQLTAYEMTEKNWSLLKYLSI